MQSSKLHVGCRSASSSSLEERGTRLHLTISNVLGLFFSWQDRSSESFWLDEATVECHSVKAGVSIL